MAMTDQLILTSSEALARRLRAEANAAQRQRGLGAWPSPQILSLERFARDSWLKSWPVERLASRSEELLLWERSIHLPEDSLLKPIQLARLFQRSWRLALQWGIDIHRGPYWNAEQSLFASSATRFESTLKSADILSAAQLPQAFCASVQAGAWLPAKIELAGFERGATAAQKDMLEALRARGCPLVPVKVGQSTPSVPHRQLVCADETRQWLLIGQHIRQALEARPAARIVVALPQLGASQRQAIDIGWQDSLGALTSPNTTGEIWHFESQDRLSDQAAVAAALLILQIQARDNRFEILSRFLLNPLVFEPEEQLACAEAETRLRQGRAAELSIRDLIAALPQDAPAALHDKLSQLARQLEAEPRQSRSLDWISAWQARWRALDFATGGRNWPLGEEFDQALLEFSGLDPWLGRISAANACHWLGEVLGQMRYQDSSARSAPVTVCSLDQAVDLAADSLFLANMSHREFPAAARPDPCLRIEDQMAAGIPSASAALRLEQARGLWQTLRQRGVELTLSCPLSTEQGAETHPSPLIGGHWEPAEPTQLGCAMPRARLRAVDPVPPLSASRLQNQPNGLGILKDQAHGGFFALVHHRLRTRALEQPLEGISPLAQGLWIHAVLQGFWEQHRHQHVLLAMDEDALLDDLSRRIDVLAGRYVPAARMGTFLQRAESDRVLRACADWLNHERRREDPFTVLHCEAPVSARLGDLDLPLRIDRVDRCDTAQGPRYLIMDYKTSRSADARYWQTHQMYEPQLPLYACSQTLQALDVPHVDGICFAQVVEDAPAFVASLNWRRKLIEPQNSAFHMDWQQTLADWRACLEQLVSDYCQGSAEYDASTDYARRPAVADLLPLIDAPMVDEEGDEA